MRLITFSVENYRSITKARKIPLEQYTLLVGPNNEGKSNILHALALGMEALAARVAMRTGEGRIVYRSVGGMSSYRWERDFPVQLQKQSGGTTKVTLEFELTDIEIQEFYLSTKSRLNGTLPIQISFGQGKFDLSIQKPGKGHVTLNKKVSQIAEFVSQRLSFEYIPAVRTASSAETVVSRLLEGELAGLERDPQYVAAIAVIDDLQAPLLKDLGNSIQQTMRSFLPTVKGVTLRPETGSRARALRRGVEVLIDDGAMTSLGRKGDGVQSLVALSLMRHASDRRQGKGSSIVAIEEPESHLHPNAIHELRNVVSQLTGSNQVVVTSHSPLFVSRDKIASNVIVNKSKAKPATSLKEVRDILGVKFSDNLQNANLVLLVEGSDDQKALSSILQGRSPEISDHIASGALQFDFLGGASSLSYKASQYINGACRVHAFLDSDASGKAAFAKAQAQNLLDVAEVNFAAIVGQDEAELEDLYDVKVYREALLNQFGVDVSIKVPGKAKKWSEATGRKFQASGKPWGDGVKEKVKNWLAGYAAENAKVILQPARAHVIDGLVTSMLVRMKS